MPDQAQSSVKVQLVVVVVDAAVPEVLALAAAVAVAGSSRAALLIGIAQVLVV